MMASVLRGVRRIAKSDNLFRHVCLSVRMEQPGTLGRIFMK